MPDYVRGKNTEQVQRRIVEDAEKLHPWPPDVVLDNDVTALNVYNKAQLQRAHSKWTPIDLIELGRVAKLIALVDNEFQLYVKEGVVIPGGRNGDKPVENPRGRAVATLNGTINSILRRLGLTSMSVSERTTGAREAEAEREVRENLENGKGDDVQLLI